MDRNSVNELERFFRQLVATLAAADPAGLTRPVSIAEIRTTLLPYRTFRRALELDTSEDYELVLLRLCAGGGGYFIMEPGETLAQFQAELTSPNPDLGVLAAGGDAHVTLEARRVAEVMDAGTTQRHPYAPPALTPSMEATAPWPTPASISAMADTDDTLMLDEIRTPAPAPQRRPPADTEDEVVPAVGEPCSYCGGAQPVGRTVNFCPHCGQSQGMTHCPGCGSEVEVGWRYCVTCGYTITA